MKGNTYEKVKKYCEEQELLEPQDGVVIGLSGGADSLCLLHFLVQLRKEWDLRLCAVHVNHGIRGQEAAEDEKASANLADAFSVDFRVFHKDIPQMASEQGLSVEEAGRVYRYQCFEQVRQELGFDKVAVAHHRDDQAETVLWHILRGSSIRGLGGIRPRREHIIRPLLVLERREIEETLRQENMEWREDSSNNKEDYTRNKLRNHVLPYLENEIQPMARQHLAELAEECQMVWEYLEEQTQECYERIVWEEEEGESGIKVSVNALGWENPVLQRQVILAMMEKQAGSRKDLGRVHVEAVMRLVKGETGKKVHLPYGLQAVREYKWLLIQPEEDSDDAGQEELELIEVESMLVSGEVMHFTDTQGQQYELTMQKRLRETLQDNVPKNHCTKWFDCDRMDANVMDISEGTASDAAEHCVETALKWRFPAEGDYLYLESSGGRKRLARVLIDEKIPTARRERMLVLAMGSHVLWIPEMGRVSAACYVTESTKNVLTAQLTRIS